MKIKEKCVCGAEIELSDENTFRLGCAEKNTEDHEYQSYYHWWLEKHKDCFFRMEN